MTVTGQRPASPPQASSPQARATMRANRSDSRLERMLRSELHRRGLRFRKHLQPVVGLRCEADVLFPRARVAVFVDGCFWHRCPVHGTDPVANGDWWRRKLDANVARDRRNDVALARAGWEVVRVWEHVPVAEMADVVEHALRRAAPSWPAGSRLVDDPSGFLSTDQAAARLGLSVVRVRQLVHSGQLPATRVGGRWIVRTADLDRFASRPPGRPHHPRRAD